MTIQIVKTGRPFMFDSQDWSLISKYRWSVGRNGYVCSRIRTEGKDVNITMHRLILGLTDPKHITDHKNRITSDNRRSNLRVCSPTENNRNKTVISSKKYLGVYYQTIPYKSIKTGTIKHFKYIKASITIASKIIYLGTFNTEELAAKAYNKAALRYFGEFANLNKL